MADSGRSFTSSMFRSSQFGLTVGRGNDPGSLQIRTLMSPLVACSGTTSGTRNGSPAPAGFLANRVCITEQEPPLRSPRFRGDGKLNDSLKPGGYLRRSELLVVDFQAVDGCRYTQTQSGRRGRGQLHAQLVPHVAAIAVQGHIHHRGHAQVRPMRFQLTSIADQSGGTSRPRQVCSLGRVCFISSRSACSGLCRQPRNRWALPISRRIARFLLARGCGKFKTTRPSDG